MQKIKQLGDAAYRKAPLSYGSPGFNPNMDTNNHDKSNTESPKNVARARCPSAVPTKSKIFGSSSDDSSNDDEDGSNSNQVVNELELKMPSRSCSKSTSSRSTHAHSSVNDMDESDAPSHPTRKRSSLSLGKPKKYLATGQTSKKTCKGNR